MAKHEAEGSDRTKQLIEDVAKPRLKHGNLGVGDRNPLWPVVADAPALYIMSGRSARERPWLA